jgi:hypothetical protein
MAVIPGSAAYREWLISLRQGDITYEEFIDWTQVSSPIEKRAGLRTTLRRFLAGLLGTWAHPK